MTGETTAIGGGGYPGIPAGGGGDGAAAAAVGVVAYWCGG